MVFMCSLCVLHPDLSGRKLGPGKCTLTDVNFDAACALLKRRWPQSTSFVEQLKLPAVLCLDCLPHSDRSQITTRTFGRQSEASFLVGQPAAQWLASQKVMKEGIVSGELMIGLVWRHHPGDTELIQQLLRKLNEVEQRGTV